MARAKAKQIDWHANEQFSLEHHDWVSNARLRKMEAHLTLGDAHWEQR